MFGKTANVTGVNNEVHVGKAGRKSVLTLKPKVGIAEEGTHTHTARTRAQTHKRSVFTPSGQRESDGAPGI